MPTARTPPVRQRRHGVELESAILDAAWDELVEAGYARLTMGSIAARARTSEPVLYRRWANKAELVFAALKHFGDTHPVATPDTGTLRGDLIANLRSSSDTLGGFYAVAAAASFSGMLDVVGRTPAQAREETLVGRGLPPVRAVYQRAHDRGEIDLARIAPAVLAMPYDLLRHDMLMTLEPLPDKRIRSIVDDLFLPLVFGPSAAQRKQPKTPSRTRARR